jgi:hypothetical protein
MLEVFATDTRIKPFTALASASKVRP